MKNYFYYYTYLEDRSFHSDIIDVIDRSEDVQKNGTNVKSKMTSWTMMKEPGFKNLIKPMVEFSKFVMKDKCRVNENFGIVSMWGMCYEDGGYSLPHDHIPSLVSSVYYINPPKDGPELVFPEMNESLQPEDGMLVVFPSWVVHEVPKKSFSGKRYTVAANMERVWWKNLNELYRV